MSFSTGFLIIFSHDYVKLVGSDLSILVIVFYEGGIVFAVCIEKFPGLDAVEKKCRYYTGPLLSFTKVTKYPPHIFSVFQGRTINGDSLSMKLRTKNGYFRKHYEVTGVIEKQHIEAYTRVFSDGGSENLAS